MSMMKMTASALAMVAVSATAAAARDNVQVAGSSTVLPYATIVAEAFAENTDFAAPVVESGGSSAGLKQFCEGVGENTIDVANSSRPIREAELATPDDPDGAPGRDHSSCSATESVCAARHACTARKKARNSPGPVSSQAHAALGLPTSFFPSSSLSAFFFLS